MSADASFYPIHAIYLNLTDRCNLRCQHCWLSSEMMPSMGGPSRAMGKEGESLSVPLMTEVIRQAKPLGLHTVKLTGGEPFLRNDVVDFVSLFHKEGLAVDIETNGTLVDRSTAQSLRALGVRAISVSLDSADPAPHDRFRGVKGAFEGATNGIHHLVGQGVRTQVIMSLFRGNAGQIEPLARLSVELGARLLKINPILPMGRGKTMVQGKRTLSVEELVKTSRWVKEELQPRVNIPLHFSLPIAFRPLTEIMAGNCPECAILNILGIVANGDISFCGIQRIQKDLVMGNVRSDRLGAVWMSHPLLKAMREMIPGQLEGICGRCFFKQRCMGSCLACTYYLEKSFTAPYWFCQEAFEKGLFPRTRYAGGQA
jgi:SynChlorMet cassette radical SAM/SPASM protein ScmF